MAKNKYDFIAEIFEKKSLNHSQKERMYKLIAKEIKEVETKDSEILKRIEEIENRLSKLHEEERAPKSSVVDSKKIPVPNPKHVADFMSLFNQRDGLKYLTHDYDENSEFRIDEFLKSANKVFTQTTEKINIPQSLWRIVKQFAFDSEQTKWISISEDYKKYIPIETGWASRELRDWSKQNNLHPIRNEKYKKIINDFKRITRVESPNLEKLISITLEKTFREELDEFEIERKDLSKADFYTHVGFLQTALQAIFEEIKKYSTTPDRKKISIKYERTFSNDGYYLRQIIITHHNSSPPKELKLLLKEWQEKGNMGKIKEKLYGYCHWSVETLIEDTPTKVNILRERDFPEYEIIEPKPDGFTHILTFYYK